ncbi:MAG: C-type lectin domain-containing protein [Candidatus Auribacterota bacterium]|nr:C-type lectin domain-containing protein [Candidatus Auribacterota bacterium]
MKKLFIASISIILLCSSSANSERYTWDVNNNQYELISAGAPITWHAANNAAIALGGHLATILSAGEQDWILSTFGTSKYIWIGGFQDPSHPEPPYDSGWQWVTGETWDYTAWGPGEPNDFSGQNQDYLVLWQNHNGGWNDAIYNDSRITYFLVEWDNIEIEDVIPEPMSILLLAVSICIRLFISKKA